MAKYTIDAVLEVWGSFDVEADSFGEAYRKAAENPGKYANLKVWNDGAEAQLRTYSHINCVGEYDIDDAVASATWSAFVGVATEGSIPKGGYCTAVAQLEEQRSPKPPVDSSILFCRANMRSKKCMDTPKFR